jgi:hypothetical protein
MFKCQFNDISDTFPSITAQTQECSNSSHWLKYKFQIGSKNVERERRAGRQAGT